MSSQGERRSKPRRGPRAGAAKTTRARRAGSTGKPRSRKVGKVRKAGSAPKGRRGRKRRPKKGTQLSLSGRGRWGGYRAGAGRKRIARDERGYVPHTKRPKVSKSTPVHVTLRCVAGLPSLRRPTHQATIEKVFARENRKGFRLVHYSIQGNHLHLIAEGDDSQALSRGIQRIASLIARTLNKRWGRRGKFFGERFDGKVIKSKRQMRNALRYVLLNHHKHELERGHFIEGFDTFSSYRFFDGWRHPGSKNRPPKRGDPVVPPRAWLLTKGWRDYGKLEPVWA